MKPPQPLNPDESPSLSLSLEGEPSPRRFSRLPVRVGRHPSCELSLSDKRVSSAHCELRAYESGVALVDLGSRNGTMIVRDQAQLTLTPNEPTPLALGDLIALGDRLDPIRLRVVSLPRRAPSFDETVLARASIDAPRPLDAPLAALLCALAAEDDPTALTRRALEACLERLSGALGVGLYPLSARRDEGVLAPTPTLWISRGGATAPTPSQSFADLAFSRRESISYVPALHGESESVAGLEGALVAPLILRSEPLGALYAQSVSRPFSEGEAEWVSALCAYLAARLTSARAAQAGKEEVRRARAAEEQLARESKLARPMLGESVALRESLGLVRKVAPTTATVLLLGETGTGKELAARTLHALSPRAEGPFYAINCGALSEQLLLSELFGHKAGAFTGAKSDRAGAFEAARGGTLFLDELGDMSLTAQVSLLRVLQEGELTPVGGDRPVRVDVRLVVATHRDLEADVKAGRFREDLYYRLSVFPVTLPPLRARAEDIPLLAERFLELSARRYGVMARGFSPEALRALRAYAWPGNVRQLEHEVERAVILAGGEPVVGLEHLSAAPRAALAPQGAHPAPLTHPAPPAPPAPAAPPLAEEIQVEPPLRAEAGALPFESLIHLELPLKEAMATLEERLIRDRLERCGQNRTRCAESLGLSRQALQVKLARWRDRDAEGAEVSAEEGAAGG
jgi:transcriptional regulator with GAF, ATPase, and Fis domain